MRADDFSEDLMEQKIKKNLDKGYSIEDIVRLLKEEQAGNVDRIKYYEARNANLNDQISYIEEKHVKKGAGQ